MELHEKLQELRKQKGITQEELAKALYVSRTAISKWESGRGYPSIDSLKAIAKFFSVSIDDLLSGDQVLSIAKQTEHHFRDLVFGLLDCSTAILFFLPFFGQPADGMVKAVSLLSLTEISPWLKIAYFAITIAMVLYGILILAFQNCLQAFWVRHKNNLSFLINAVGALLFIISSQPYAATFLFLFFIIKAMIRKVSPM